MIHTPKKTSVFRREHFNAAHRLHNPDLSDDENRAIFGKCNNPNFHGHNYELVVQIIGEINPKTGYVFDMKILSDLVKENIIERFDHKNLNIEVAEFQELNPTAENIAFVIYEILRKKINSELEIRIKLYETDRNFVEYPAY